MARPVRPRPMRSRNRLHSERPRCRGVAAIEFALIALLLLLFLYGLATFGAVLYTQQAVSRAAEDGARAAGMPSPLEPVGSVELEENIKRVVRESLAQSLIAPPDRETAEERLAWLSNPVNAQVDVEFFGEVGQPWSRAEVSVRYSYSENRVLPSLPLLDTSSWMSDTLEGRASVALELR